MSRVFQREEAWWIDFKDAHGVRRRKKIGPSKRIAKEVLDGMLGNVARRVHLGVIDDSPISFADFAEKIWWERVKHTLKPRSQERWKGILFQHLKPAFPGALRAITVADAGRYVTRRLTPKICERCKGKKEVRPKVLCLRCAGSGEVAPQASTINRELTVLKHIVRRAVAWEYLGRNPFLDSNGGLVDDLKNLKEAGGRNRFLGEEEIERLQAACEKSQSAYLRPFVIVALNTGMRRNEILSLTRRSVDWQNRVAMLEDTKNGESRQVPLNDLALNMLRDLPTRIDGKLFPIGPNQVTMLFGRAAKRAKIEDFRLHDLRHTFASHHAMKGVQGRGLQALLGHKDGRMTARYSHLSDAYLRSAVDSVCLGTAKRDLSKPEKDGTYLAPALREVEKV